MVKGNNSFESNSNNEALSSSEKNSNDSNDEIESDIMQDDIKNESEDDVIIQDHFKNESENDIEDKFQTPTNTPKKRKVESKSNISRNLLNKLKKNGIIKIKKNGDVMTLDKGIIIPKTDFFRVLFRKNARYEDHLEFFKNIKQHLDFYIIPNIKLKQALSIGGSQKLKSPWISLW